MSKTRLILASILALSAAACGQMSQGKQQETPAAQGNTPAATAETPATADGKPAESSGGGDAANKPAATDAAPTNK